MSALGLCLALKVAFVEWMALEEMEMGKVSTEEPRTTPSVVPSASKACISAAVFLAQVITQQTALALKEATACICAALGFEVDSSYHQQHPGNWEPEAICSSHRDLVPVKPWPANGQEQ